MNKYRYKPTRYTLCAVTVLCIFLISCETAQIPSPPAPVPVTVPVTQPVLPQQPFTIVALPDTQLYSKSLPATFAAQTQWIKDNTVSKNIVFTVQLGDITDSQRKMSEPVKGEWANAKKAMDLLNGLKYSVLPGNHDNLVNGKIDNKGAFTKEGKLLWDQVIKQHKNVSLVLCGHVCTESTITKTGEYGNVVNILLSDYQCDEKGGNGYLRLMEFIPSQSIIRVEAFSPLINKLRDKSTGFDLPYTFQ